MGEGKDDDEEEIDVVGVEDNDYATQTNREVACDYNEGKGQGQLGQGHVKENSLSTDSLSQKDEIYTAGHQSPSNHQPSRKDNSVDIDPTPDRENSCSGNSDTTSTLPSKSTFRSLKILELEYTAERSCRDPTKASDGNSKQLLSKVASNSGSFLIARLLEKSLQAGADDQWTDENYRVHFYSPEDVVYQPMGFQVETTQR